MQAFHNDKAVKAKYINRIKAHAEADEIVKGKYWEDGKGCAVGCTIHGSNHTAYETELGIPKWLALLEDRIFEGLPNEQAKKFPLQFLQSIKVGADLDKVKIPFLVFVVNSSLKSFDNAKYSEVTLAIKNVLKELKRPTLDLEKLRTARSAAADAAAAAYAAYAAAAYAAYAADAAAAAYAAYAADAAAADAAAAYAAADADAAAAAYAAYAADAAAAAYAAYAAAAAYAARQKTFTKFANKLLKLLKECK